MHGRSALGSADVDDAHLAALVAATLDVDTVELLGSRAEVVAYDIEALTTAGRYRVTGRARHAGGEAGFAFFVKVHQSWSRTPIVPGRWDRAGHARAAHLLGRLAASPRVRPLATVADPQQYRTPRMYAEGRLALQVVPALHDAGIWRHPLVAATFDDALRRDLVADACTRNLLVAADRPELVLIDFGFWGPWPLGFDLGQLLLGEVQLGERPAAELPDDERVCLAAYVDGLRAEGCTVDATTVRRAHALQMLLFSALSALPFELLDAEPTRALVDVCRQRAAAARFVLDLATATR